MKVYGILGETSRQFLTFQGRVITHHDPMVLSWFFPKNEVQVVRAREEDTFPLWAHPDVAHLNLERPKI